MGTVRLKPLVLNTGLLAATLLIIFFVFEFLLRVLYIQPMNITQPHIHRASPVEGLVYDLLPGADTEGYGPEHVTVNSQGFRSPERDPSKPVIAVIGDSYTFGHGVNNNETNPAYLQELLPSHYVLNAGVDGYNIEQQAIVMREKVKPLNPEVVIVEFVFNDMVPKGRFNEDGTIEVGQKTKEEQAAAIREAITKKGLINFPGKFFLQRHSAVFNFVERTTKGLPFRKRTVDTRDTITAQELAFYEQWFTELAAHVQTDKKIFVIWPESNMHTESRAFLRTLAQKHGFVMVDLYDTLGNGYRHLGWDYHPQASVHREVAKTLAKTIKETWGIGE
jgi:hypothetical protein